MAHPHEFSLVARVFARRHRRRVEAGARVYAHPARRVKNAGDAAVEATMSSVSTAESKNSRGINRLHCAFSCIMMLPMISIDD